jgi:peptide deformylase
MAIRNTIQIGNPKLKRNNSKIADAELGKPEIKELIQDLKDTMYDVGLIGIAAPQIGENYQVFITHVRVTEYRKHGDKLRVYINPEIVAKSEEKIVIYEGCGSVTSAGFFGPVQRPKWVEIRAMDEAGNLFTLKADGILGRVIQHEYGHLQGETFVEHIADYSDIYNKENYIEKIKTSKKQLKNSKITTIEYKELD